MTANSLGRKFMVLESSVKQSLDRANIHAAQAWFERKFKNHALTQMYMYNM